MKVTLTETRTARREFEVSFPLYRRYDVDVDSGPSVTIYSRIEHWGRTAVFRQVDITLTGLSNARIAIREFNHFVDGDPDYVLGQGEYASSPQEFTDALRHARALLEQV